MFFKTTKSLLRLQKEFQGRSYDLLISHTTIVFTRYIVLSWQNRCHTDERTLGGLFYDLCDEVNELDWAVALQQLIELLQERSAYSLHHHYINLIHQNNLQESIHETATIQFSFCLSSQGSNENGIPIILAVSSS